MRQVMSIAGRYIPQGDFCFALVMLDAGNDQRRKRQFLNVKKLVPAIDTGIVDIREEDGQQLVKRYALSHLPHLLLLDRDGRIAAVNVDAVDFERHFLEVLGTR